MASTSGNGQRGPKPVHQSMIYRTAMFGVRRRRLVVGIWLVLFIGALPLVKGLTQQLSSGGFEVPGSQSDQVKHAIETRFTGESNISALAVLHADSLTATDPEFKGVVDRARENLAKVKGVTSVDDPYAFAPEFISADGRTVTALVRLSGTQDTALKIAPAMQDALDQAAKGTEVQALLTGAPSFYRAFQDITVEDLKRSDSIAIPVALVILVVAFGSIVAAGMPVFLAVLGLMIAYGLIFIVASISQVSVFAQNIATMIGIGVGIDYSLFILHRYRVELRKGMSVGNAVAEAMATSGKAVLVSALTVVVALSGTLLVSINSFRSMGIAAMIAVAVAGAAALTLLPALLGWVGHRIDKLSIHRRHAEEGRLWHKWAMGVMRRPWTALIICLLILGSLAWPARGLKLGSSGPSILPPDAKPRLAVELLRDAFGEGQVSPVKILITSPAPVAEDDQATLDRLAQLSDQIAKDPEVVRVNSIASLAAAAQGSGGPALPPAVIAAIRAQYVSTDGRSTFIDVVTRHSPQSDQVHGLVERLRATLPGEMPAGDTVLVGGDPGLDVDLNHELGSKLPLVVGLVLVLSFLVLMLFFRSLLLPLKAVLMNLASVLAAYGVLTFVFQEGHLEGLLGFKAAGHIEAFLPLFLFTILFGLSMDYEVFLLARIREEYLRSGDNTEAVGWGLENTARIITSAAAIMVTVFGAFAFARLVPIKAMGFGLAVAVLLDASIIRMILVPATMRLMGDWNWWIPKWLDRILPHVSIEGSSRPEPATSPETTAVGS